MPHREVPLGIAACRAVALNGRALCCASVVVPEQSAQPFLVENLAYSVLV